MDRLGIWDLSKLYVLSVQRLIFFARCATACMPLLHQTLFMYVQYLYHAVFQANLQIVRHMQLIS